jgi:hypothetical protein
MVNQIELRRKCVSASRSYASSCLDSSRRSFSNTPDTIPVNSPVEAKKTELFVASANTGSGESKRAG